MSGMTNAERRERERKLIAVIARAADEGRPCPSNAEFARIIGVASTESACRVLVEMERRGVIMVKRFTCRRIVTIVATGQRTAGEPGTAHWRFRDPAATPDRKPKQARRDPVAPSATLQRLVRVNREPCTWCGVRADVGCDCTARAAAPLMFIPAHLHAAGVTHG